VVDGEPELRDRPVREVLVIEEPSGDRIPTGECLEAALVEAGSSAVSDAVTRRAPAIAARSFGMLVRFRPSNVENGVFAA
jgi:hypothetical protein